MTNKERNLIEMIHITEKKLVAAIQIALVGECENADRTEAKLLHDIKALSIANVSNQRELLIDLLDKLEKGGSNRFVSKEWIVDNYLQGN